MDYLFASCIWMLAITRAKLGFAMGKVSIAGKMHALGHDWSYRNVVGGS